jgi:hypothetical protein
LIGSLLWCLLLLVLVLVLVLLLLLPLPLLPLWTMIMTTPSQYSLCCLISVVIAITVTTTTHHPTTTMMLRVTCQYHPLTPHSRYSHRPHSAQQDHTQRHRV